LTKLSGCTKKGNAFVQSKASKKLEMFIHFTECYSSFFKTLFQDYRKEVCLLLLPTAQAQVGRKTHF